jgi:hypothetical protein
MTVVLFFAVEPGRPRPEIWTFPKRECPAPHKRNYTLAQKKLAFSPTHGVQLISPRCLASDLLPQENRGWL